ncbi:hypothetical protein F5X97DRAFT_213340 [Nemania serpens]|nr:hypothetical protein F5X97DRAFT_213340 [Nemania serpens]
MRLPILSFTFSNFLFSLLSPSPSVILWFWLALVISNITLHLIQTPVIRETHPLAADKHLPRRPEVADICQKLVHGRLFRRRFLGRRRPHESPASERRGAGSPVFEQLFPVLEDGDWHCVVSGLGSGGGGGGGRLVGAVFIIDTVFSLSHVVVVGVVAVAVGVGCGEEMCEVAGLVGPTCLVLSCLACRAFH